MCIRDRDIEDDALEFMLGTGEIEFRADVDGDGTGMVKMLANEADVGNNLDTIKTNGRDLTIVGADIVLRDIDTSGSTSGDGGSISLEATGDITTQNLDSFSSSKGRHLGKGGAISIKAGGNITTQNIHSHSEGDDSGDGGAISLEATGNITLSLIHISEPTRPY